MFIELIDGLRCTSQHPPISLVAAITEREGRHVTRGTLGCPTCHREYPILDGVTWFTRPSEKADAVGCVWRGEHDASGAIRIGALLAATEGITVALVGDWARYAQELTELLGLRAFAVNPRGSVDESERLGVLHSGNRLPFRGNSLRGIAIDDSGWSLQDLELATRVLAYGGRMVAPASSPMPSDIEEIARDDDVWVGEKRAELVSLHGR